MADSDSGAHCPNCNDTGETTRKNIAGQEVVCTCPYCLATSRPKEKSVEDKT